MRWKRPAARLALLLVAGALLGLPAAGLADDPGDASRPRRRARRGGAAGARSSSSRSSRSCARAESALAGIESRLDRLERERASSRRQLAVARRTLAEAGGAARRSGACALHVGTARRARGLPRRRVARGRDRGRRQPPPCRRRNERSARRGAGRPSGRASLLRRQTARAPSSASWAAAAARTVELAGAQAERLSYIAELQAEQVLNERQIAEAVAAAEAAHRRRRRWQTAVAETAPSISSIGAQSIVAAPPGARAAAAASALAAGAGGANRQDADRRRHGLHDCAERPRRASPLAPASWPSTRSVIPLGTRMTIPGYGEASRPTRAARSRACGSTSGWRRRPRRRSGSGRPSRSPCTEQRLEIRLGEQWHAAALSLRELRAPGSSPTTSPVVFDDTELVTFAPSASSAAAASSREYFSSVPVITYVLPVSGPRRAVLLAHLEAEAELPQLLDERRFWASANHSTTISARSGPNPSVSPTSSWRRRRQAVDVPELAGEVLCEHPADAGDVEPEQDAGERHLLRPLDRARPRPMRRSRRTRRARAAAPSSAGRDRERADEPALPEQPDRLLADALDVGDRRPS